MSGQRVGALWRMARPIAVANLTQVAVAVTDTALVGNSSTTALAGVALAAPVYLIAVMVLRSWSTAVQIMVSRRRGGGDSAGIAAAATASLVAAVLSGIVFAAVLLAVGGAVLGALGGEDLAAVDQGRSYLAVVVLGLPLASATFALHGIFGGLGVTRPVMSTALVVATMNFGLGSLLVLQLDLGVVGAGVATVVSLASGLGVTVWAIRWESLRGWANFNLRDRRSWIGALPGLSRLAWPEAALFFLGYANEALISGFVARIGAPDLAAYRVLDNLTTVLYSLIAAVGAAITILAGYELGAARSGGVSMYLRGGFVLAGVLTVPLAIAIMLVSVPVYGVLVQDPVVVDRAVDATALAVLSMAPMLIALTVSGVLRAAGDNVWIMVASVVCDVVVLVPASWLLGVHLGYGLDGVFVAWLGYGCGMLVILSARYRSGAWRGSTV